MKKATCVKLTLLAFCYTSNSFAQFSDYRCKIERISSSVTSDGKNEFLASYVGKEFTVDRKTGIMVGVLKNSYVNKPQVIDSGSKENSFKVIASLKVTEGAGAGSNMYALTIDEHQDGKIKPFVFLQNNIAFFGHCSHY